MRIEIKSKQNYGTHTEEMNETFECKIKEENNCLEVWNENIHIIIEENKITQIRNGNKIIIDIGKTNTCEYKTEHGSFEMKVTGTSIERRENKATAVYEIQIAGMPAYTNEIEIII